MGSGGDRLGMRGGGGQPGQRRGGGQRQQGPRAGAHLVLLVQVWAKGCPRVTGRRSEANAVAGAGRGAGRLGRAHADLGAIARGRRAAAAGGAELGRRQGHRVGHGVGVARRRVGHRVGCARWRVGRAGRRVGAAGRRVGRGGLRAAARRHQRQRESSSQGPETWHQLLHPGLRSGSARGVPERRRAISRTCASLRTRGPSSRIPLDVAGRAAAGGAGETPRGRW